MKLSHWTRGLFSRTRGRIIVLFRARPQTVGELLWEAVGLTDKAIWAHLNLELAAADPAKAIEAQMRLATRDLHGWLRRGHAVPESFVEARQLDGNLPGALGWLIARRLRIAFDGPPAPLNGIGRDGEGTDFHHLPFFKRKPICHPRRPLFKRKSV